MSDFLPKLFSFQRLIELRMQFRCEKVDMSSLVESQVEVLKIRSVLKLQLKFNRMPPKDFLRTFPLLFPNTRRMLVECCDSDLMDELQLEPGLNVVVV